MSFPSISSPKLSHPFTLSLANSSIRGNSPHNSTIRSLISAGFLLCSIILASHICDTDFDTRLGCPFVPIKHTSEFERVQNPSPIKYVFFFLFLFTQLKPHVLYLNPHLSITSIPSFRHGNVIHKNKIQSLSAILSTGRAIISLIFIV